MWVDGTLRSSTATGRTGQPLQSRNPGKVVQFREHLDSSFPGTTEGDAERTDSSGISPGSEPKAEGISTGADNLSEATVPKVQNTYVTRTARLTAAYKERRGSRQCARGCQVASTRSSPLPWRPGYPEQDQFKHYRGFSVSSLKGIDRDNLFTPKKQSTHRTAAKVGTTSACSPSTQQTKSSPSERRSPSTNERSQCFAAKDFNRTFLVEGAVSANGDTPAEERNTAAPGAMPAEPGSDSSGTPYIEDFEDESGADEDLDSNSSNQSEEDSPPDPMHAVEPTSNQHALVCPTDTVNGGVVTSDMTASDATTVDVTNSDVTSSDMMTNGVMTNDVRFTVSSPAVTGAGSVPVRRCVMHCECGGLLCMCGHVRTYVVMFACTYAGQERKLPVFCVLCHFSPGLCLITRESDYLAFIARVTQDVLAKGVYTDAGLKLLFEEHTERNRELLDIVSVHAY